MMAAVSLLAVIVVEAIPVSEQLVPGRPEKPASAATSLLVTVPQYFPSARWRR